MSSKQFYLLRVVARLEEWSPRNPEFRFESLMRHYYFEWRDSTTDPQVPRKMRKHLGLAGSSL